MVAYHKFSPQNRASWRAPYYYTRNAFWIVWKNYPIRAAVKQTLKLIYDCLYASMEQRTNVYLKALIAAFSQSDAIRNKRKAVRADIVQRLRVPFDVFFYVLSVIERWLVNLKNALIIRSASFQQLDKNFPAIEEALPDHRFQMLTHEHGVKLAEKYKLLSKIYVYPYKQSFSFWRPVQEFKDQKFDCVIVPVSNLTGAGFFKCTSVFINDKC